MAASTDEELAVRARRGSRRAVDVLFRRHWDRLWRVAYAVTGRRDVADDVAQDAFQRAVAGLRGYDPARPFTPWLHRIVVNTAIDAVRADRRLAPLPDDAPDHGDPLDAAIVRNDLARALAGLGEEQRAAVVLRYVLGHDLAATAEILGVPVGTVQSRCGRALAAMRVSMGEGIDVR
jgi:RNA polymerase sigma-70 factor, ECF subfamily